MFTSCDPEKAVSLQNSHIQYDHIIVLSDLISEKEDYEEYYQDAPFYFVILGYYDANGDFINNGLFGLTKVKENVYSCKDLPHKETFILSDPGSEIKKGNCYTISKPNIYYAYTNSNSYENPIPYHFLSECKDNHPSFTKFEIEVNTNYIVFPAKKDTTWEKLLNEDILSALNFTIDNNSVNYYYFGDGETYQIHYVDDQGKAGDPVKPTDKITAEGSYIGVVIPQQQGK